MNITLKQAKAQRPIKNLPVNMKLTGWISPYLIYTFSRAGLSPNILSFTWILLSLMGFYLIALGGYLNSIVGILVYHFALLLDSTDGGVARILKKTNAGGEFLDRFFSTINRSILLFALGFGIFRINNSPIFLYLGVYSAIFVFLENTVKMKSYESLINSERLDIIQNKIAENKKQDRSFIFYAKEAFRPGNPFTLLFFAIIFNLSHIYLYIFSIVITIQFLLVFVKEFLFLKNTKQNN